MKIFLAGSRRPDGWSDLSNSKFLSFSDPPSHLKLLTLKSTYFCGGCINIETFLRSLEMWMRRRMPSLIKWKQQTILTQGTSWVGSLVDHIVSLKLFFFYPSLLQGPLFSFESITTPGGSLGQTQEQLYITHYLGTTSD